MKKILVVLTNTEKYESIDRPTGLWLGEAARFVDVVQKAGYHVDYVSPKGGYVPLDPSSFSTANAIDWKYYNDSDFRNRALSNSLTPDEAMNSVDDYSAIYYTGGHGVMWDFPNCTSIQAIAEKIYANGGFVTSVCHGAVGLLRIKAPNGSLLIKDKKVTGFSNEEEDINQTTSAVPFLTETEMKNAQANYISKPAWSVHVEKDGKLITGQNPQSAGKVAVELVQALSE
ncbi:type 1 glutamine amidotransferase domain-containing protein [Lactobacillus curvatus]|nr:type 1 glutamine amidotransferase domain-containing protein [Latilactobacillus curvatus]MSE22953.1 type 1 glutamine amidotransferase domain-containing protein [Latilactobacillus curvatus]